MGESKERVVVEVSQIRLFTPQYFIKKFPSRLKGYFPPFLKGFEGLNKDYVKWHSKFCLKAFFNVHFMFEMKLIIFVHVILTVNIPEKNSHLILWLYVAHTFKKSGRRRGGQQGASLKSLSEWALRFTEIKGKGGRKKRFFAEEKKENVRTASPRVIPPFLQANAVLN